MHTNTTSITSHRISYERIASYNEALLAIVQVDAVDGVDLFAPMVFEVLLEVSPRGAVASTCDPANGHSLEYHLIRDDEVLRYEWPNGATRYVVDGFTLEVERLAMHELNAALHVADEAWEDSLRASLGISVYGLRWR